MDTIADFVSKDMRIAELEKEIINLEIKLKKELRNKSKIKCKYEELKKRYVPNYKGNKDVALDLIKRFHEVGDITLIEISKTTKLSYSMIRGYSSEYLKGVSNG